jgi:hypothetical protein
MSNVGFVEDKIEEMVSYKALSWKDKLVVLSGLLAVPLTMVTHNSTIIIREAVERACDEIRRNLVLIVAAVKSEEGEKS